MAEINSPKTGEGVFVQIFSGLGMGLLVGIIVGLSVSPVVSIILGALASLLAAFLGLQDSGSATQSDDIGVLRRLKVNGLRIGSFGFACVAAIVLGLFIRSQEVFSIPIKEQIARWTDAGFDLEEARQLVIYERLALAPEGKQVQPVGEIQKAHSNALFASLAEIDLCYEISLQRFGNEVQEVLQAYRRQDNDKLAALADAIERLPAQNQGEILKSVEEVLCELQKASQKTTAK